MTASRLTTERSACTMCSIQMMATPSRWTRRITSTSSCTSCSPRPPAISSSSSTRGAVASARASSRRLRSSRVRAPARVLALAREPGQLERGQRGRVRQALGQPAPEDPAHQHVLEHGERRRTDAGSGAVQRDAGAAPRVRRARSVTSRPRRPPRPRSGRRRPIRRLSAVVLPAPFGPMTPERLALAATASAEPVDDPQRAERLGDALQREQRGHQTPPARGRRRHRPARPRALTPGRWAGASRRRGCSTPPGC